MAGILDGIKVIEVASMAAGPNATVILADLGAEVIKVEPLSGDPWRYGHLTPGLPPSDIPWTTFIQNRTKKSVALNLKKSEAQAVLNKLVAEADVFLTNSPRPVQKALNHSYEDIKAINPKIIFASINGFGLNGSDKDDPGFDATAWYARTGVAEELRPRDGAPVAQPVGLGDLGTASTLAGAVMGALFHRERTGNGSEVSTSLMNNGLWANSCMMQAALVGVPPMPKFHVEDWPNPIAGGRYRTADGRYIMVVEINPNNAGNLLAAFGGDQLKNDERFSTPQLRFKNQRELFDQLQKYVAANDLATVKARLKSCGVNFSVVQTTEECTQDEHMIANGCFPEVEGADGIRTVDSPMQIQSEGTEKVKPRKPPAVGEHTLTELAALGYSEEDIEAMVEAGAVGLSG